LKRLLCLAFLVLAVPAYATDPPIAWVVVPDVAPPIPPTPPAGVPQLSGDLLYVLDCKVPCFLLKSPNAGIVSVTEEAGPLRIRGRFVGGNGRMETRTFSGTKVFVVEAVGSGRVELFVAKEGAKSPADVFRQLIDVNQGPQPPPEPPGPGPGPTPGPSPTVDKRVLFIYERQDLAKMSETQRAVLYSTDLHAYIDGKAGKDRWRVWDKDTTGIEADAKEWVDLWKRPRASLPWIIIGNGKAGYEGPLPATQTEALTLLRKYLEP
jgi:hypothetical protein